MDRSSFSTSIVLIAMLVALGACSKTATDPGTGTGKLRIYHAGADSLSTLNSFYAISLTVLDPNGYGVGGAYIDFYDPMRKQPRRIGPSTANGELDLRDTVPTGLATGTYSFAFVGSHDGNTASDTLRIWLYAFDARPYTIDSLWVTTWQTNTLEVKWTRPSADLGPDTLVVKNPSAGADSLVIVPYPASSVLLTTLHPYTISTLTVHNAFSISPAVSWAPAQRFSGIRLYENSDHNSGDNCGIYLQSAIPQPTSGNSDLFLATDTSNHQSGVSIVSPSLKKLSKATTPNQTFFSGPTEYIDSGLDLRELYYSHDLTNYIFPGDSVFRIPLPDSGRYSTAFYALNNQRYYARLSVGPVTHDQNNHRYVILNYYFQLANSQPYAARPRKRK